MTMAPEGVGERVPVFVVDDDEIVRTWLKYALKESEFYVVDDVGSAEAALASIDDARPGLLLIDYRLPDTNGIELVQQLRERDVDTPAVLMTASTESGLNQTALAAGFDGAYVKSGRRDPLLETLRLVLTGEPAFDHRIPRGEYTAAALDPDDREVLDLVTSGFTTQELAERSGITPEEARSAFERASERIQKRPRRREPAPAIERPAKTAAEAPSPAPAREAPKSLAYAERAAVLAAFLRSVRETMSGLRRELSALSSSASGTAPGAALADYAHTLKGGAATAGLQDIAALAAQIEATARAAPRLAVDEIRRLEVLGRELDVRVERLPAVDAVGLPPESSLSTANGDAPLATIVYIDDDPASLKLMDVLLAREPGFRLVTARSGLEGVQAVAAQHPDLVFLDLRLPDIDGLDVLARVRALEGGANLPVVLLTGEAQGRLGALQEAADLVLTKPLDLGRFFEIVTLLRQEAALPEPDRAD
jgi:DNA-binding NarL/FixJ family response regulator/HPt (histidine-containing phosphotransfer) domain-containing protein